jgi:DNA replication protein DnaC
MSDWHAPSDADLADRFRVADDAPRKRHECGTCEDQGWVVVERPAPVAIYGPGQTVVSAVACLCVQGERRRVANTRDGRRPLSLDEVWTPEAIAQAFPSGTAHGAAVVARERLVATGLPVVMREWTLDSYRRVVIGKDPDRVRYGHYGENWINERADERADIVLFGSKGTGKTGLAVALARGAYDKGASMRYTTARELILTFRQAMRDDEGGGELGVDARFRDPQVLVIDEVGGAPMTDYQLDTLTSLVDARQKAKKQTILTLNVADNMLSGDAQQQVIELFGARLADRLVEAALWWPLMGASKRKARTRVRREAGHAAAD